MIGAEKKRRIDLIDSVLGKPHQTGAFFIRFGKVVIRIPPRIQHHLRFKHRVQKSERLSVSYLVCGDAGTQDHALHLFRFDGIKRGNGLKRKAQLHIPLHFTNAGAGK